MTGYAETAAGNFFPEAGMELIAKPHTSEALAAKISDMINNDARGSRRVASGLLPSLRH